MIRTLTLAALLALAACGGKDKAAATSTTPGDKHEHGEGGGHDHSAGLSAEMVRFHEVLRPLWHLPAGPERMTKTCEGAAQLQTEADAVAKATPPPTANADTWTAGTRALVAAVGELVTECKSKSTAGFEAAFSKVHDAFHALMKASAEERPMDPGTGSAAGSASPGGDDHGGHKH